MALSSKIFKAFQDIILQCLMSSHGVEKRNHCLLTEKLTESPYYKNTSSSSEAAERNTAVTPQTAQDPMLSSCLWLRKSICRICVDQHGLQVFIFSPGYIPNIVQMLKEHIKQTQCLRFSSLFLSHTILLFMIKT